MRGTNMSFTDLCFSIAALALIVGTVHTIWAMFNHEKDKINPVPLTFYCWIVIISGVIGLCFHPSQPFLELYRNHIHPSPPPPIPAATVPPVNPPTPPLGSKEEKPDPSKIPILERKYQVTKEVAIIMQIPADWRGEAHLPLQGNLFWRRIYLRGRSDVYIALRVFEYEGESSFAHLTEAAEKDNSSKPYVINHSIERNKKIGDLDASVREYDLIERNQTRHIEYEAHLPNTRLLINLAFIAPIYEIDSWKPLFDKVQTGLKYEIREKAVVVPAPESTPKGDETKQEAKRKKEEEKAEREIRRTVQELASEYEHILNGIINDNASESEIDHYLTRFADDYTNLKSETKQEYKKNIMMGLAMPARQVENATSALYRMRALQFYFSEDGTVQVRMETTTCLKSSETKDYVIVGSKWSMVTWRKISGSYKIVFEEDRPYD